MKIIKIIAFTTLAYCLLFSNTIYGKYIKSNNCYQTDTSIKFYYRNIQEDYLDTLSTKRVNNLFGNWIITSVAKTGSSPKNENEIKLQIGKELYFDSTNFNFDFFDSPIRVHQPTYKLNFINTLEEMNLKTTTFFYGYRPCRKNVSLLNISNKIYFEIITFTEMAYFFEGRIYFLNKKDN